MGKERRKRKAQKGISSSSGQTLRRQEAELVQLRNSMYHLTGRKKDVLGKRRQKEPAVMSANGHWKQVRGTLFRGSDVNRG